jgi:hypothetical protein
VLSSHTPLPFTYNVKNTVQLMDDLLKIPQEHLMKFASLDISSMYSNIPTGETTKILNDLCIKRNVDDKTRKEIVKITQTIVNQYNFRFQDIYQQNEGMVMGSPASSILSEVYTQHMEGTTIPMILSKHNIKGYYRYVDDVLIVYTDNTTNTHTVLDEYNSISPKLDFTLEEQNDKINFLEFTIVKTHKGLSFDIYRKPPQPTL